LTGFEGDPGNNWTTHENDPFEKDEGEIRAPPEEFAVADPVTSGPPPPLTARVDLSTSGNDGEVVGHVNFSQSGAGVRVQGEIYGLRPGPHGFHVHTKPTVENGCLASEGHFNPFNVGVRTPENNPFFDI
jgi:Cu/Zn superoxide dismutase